ncbi:glycosyltransferase family 4 protein [Brachybacterium subflavum]|uniref:glycosyltransferase family 4 protein n=1 Tax=Brachybacterium subflavum TaxID=2585206 RepID=UPI0012661809|nr:glycosyltransferase family 1 protein [Brachybacterium subflavum]
MRILVIAETFLPHMSGVTGSVLHMADQLTARGDDVSVIAPHHAGAPEALTTACGARVPIHEVPSLPLPGYPGIRVATVSATSLRRAIAAHAPDVVHLASPIVLGGRAAIAARQLDLPVVAVYQTDVPGFAAAYGLPFLENACWQILRDLHQRATLTLAPSTASRDLLASHQIPRIRLWGRGVDTEQFRPTARSRALRDELADPAERIVAYVGRLAPEKQVRDLRVVHDMPGVRVVIVGDGPERADLERSMPRARFVGFRRGADLAAHLASADLFIHPGEHETFCQTIQEAMASGLPAIAPRAGGPIDLIDPSRTGWLYAPGDLAELRARTADLLFDDAKREAMGRAALDSVRGRSWSALAEQLRGHYEQAILANAGVLALG